ncbi:MAG: hypothetical protein KA972_07805, partial [Brachymonas sp.]|nr:hypothetical protein [Brachymonas sp.]
MSFGFNARQQLFCKWLFVGWLVFGRMACMGQSEKVLSCGHKKTALGRFFDNLLTAHPFKRAAAQMRCRACLKSGVG